MVSLTLSPFSLLLFQIRFVVTDRAAYVLNSWSPLQQNLNHASVPSKILYLLSNKYLINKMQIYVIIDGMEYIFLLACVEREIMELVLHL